MDETSQTDSPTLLQVDSTPLELDDDYFDVLSELTPLAASWKSIGFALRLKHDALEKIDKQHSGDPSACLASVVTEWLRKNYNVKKFGEPTWQRLAKAVGDAAGGANKALSKRIAKKHTPRLSALQTPSSPLGSAETQAQGTITSSSPTPSAMSDHLSPLQPPVQPAVVPRATSYSPHHSPQADQSPPPTPIPIFNYPSTPPPPLQLSKSAVFALENRQAITAKFAAFQTKVCNKLLVKRVDTEQVSLFFTNEFPPGDCIPQPPASLPEIFKAITYHHLWDFFHYSPLVHIVQTFGANDPEMESWVQTYKKDLKAYSIITAVEDFIEADLDVTDLDIDDLPPVKRAKCDPRYYCPVEWKTSFLDHTLQHLTEVWEMFSNRYLLPDSPPTALLDRVRRGCVSITWLVPTHMIPQLIKGVESNTEFFQEHHISKVIVDGKCVYEEKMPPLNVPLLENTKAKMCGYGRYPSVTLNNRNIVVAVCNSEVGSTLKSRVGVVSEVDGGLSIDWGEDEGYGSGFFPRVSVNNDGIVVEVHQSLRREVQYRIGRVNEATKTIDWWQESLKIEKGYAPAVALTDNGHVVVVYENKDFAIHKTYYCLGIIDSESKTAIWTVQHKPYGNGGQNLSISMNNDGTIIEVHRSPAGVNVFHLWSCIGKLDLDDQRNPVGISWNDAVKQGKYRFWDRFLPSSMSNPQSSPYSYGYYPFVSINNHGKFIEVHQTLTLRRLIYQSGVIDEDTIQWSQIKECQYDMGYAPVVALNDYDLVVEIHETNVAYRGNTWWSKVGKYAVLDKK